MKGVTLKFILSASLLLNITVLCTAGYLYYKQTRSWVSPFGHRIERDRFLFEELSLQPGQMRAMREKAIPFRAEIDGRRKTIEEKREALFALLRSDHPDREAMEALIAEISRMQEEMQKRIALHILEEKALLTKDQQEKFLDLIENAMKNGRQKGCPTQ
ncbi:MAG: periplasmic heavy metal sensor [Alphaproteobacteria bacterium]|uniref:Periplasmic heavy metal sensor n=1 Tax=Candidatus Nitrobium versatile TaxID=2884831 RepID=A0A953M2X5_9BACT|nr:periplasmic heavy metal sensor [Candidatus Nitrobium versatile]